MASTRRELRRFVAVVIALAFARRIAEMLRLSTAATAFVLAFLALDQLQVFYGMVGMETQVAVAVLLVSTYYVVREDALKAGLTLGVAVLARPDFLNWVGVALIWLLLRSRSNAIRATLAAAAVLFPWIVFTTLYYGSPIPQTIQAKAVVYASVSKASWISHRGLRKESCPTGTPSFGHSRRSSKTPSRQAHPCPSYSW